MFASLVSRKDSQYRGVDRFCDLYENAKIGVFGKVDAAVEAAWLDYIDLLDVEPITCNDEALRIMTRIINLCEKNRKDLEIILFTKDMDEHCDKDAAFIGYDVVGASYSSVLPETACNMPEQFMKGLNDCRLFSSFAQAAEFAEYANSLTTSDIEPDFPYAPVKVYVLKI